MKKYAIAVVMIVSVSGLLALAACDQDAGSSDSGPATGAQTTSATTPGDTGSAEIAITLEELAEFDGKDGRPAYVAVDGVIYDVSSSSAWADGVHAPCNLDAMAGKDLSETLRQAPSNMRSLLARMPVVGRLE